MVKPCFLGLLLIVPTIAAGARIEIDDGDTDALFATVEAAEEIPGTQIIELAPFGIYFDTRVLKTTSAVVIIGNGATINFRIKVDENGSLFLSDAELQGDGSGTTSTVGASRLLTNNGNLALNRVTVTDHSSLGLISAVEAILNRGTFVTRNSTFSGNIALPDFESVLRNLGNATVETSTFANNSSLLSAIDNSGVLSIRNAIFSGNDVQNCDGMITSVGGNIDSDGTCNLNRATDQTGVNPLLNPLADNGGLTLTHLPAPDSPAIDAGVGGIRIDQRGFHRVGKRDSGAVEVDGFEGETIDAWASGTWYFAKENGHYFVVEVVSDSLVLAYWLTYDTEGNQRWVYATGEPEGSRVLLEAYTSEGMRSPEFRRGDRVQTPWGVLELHFRDCDHAWAEWHTGEPGFVADTTPLRRLIGVDGNPCPESEEKTSEDFNRTARWSGTWHVPAQDGHYFVVQGISNETVLVYWLTYDEDGSPHWVYAAGTPDGDVLVADAYITEGMQAPEFDPDDREQTLWGTLEFEFRSCNFAEVAWETDLAGFNPGSEVLRRVTALEGLGCN